MRAHGSDATIAALPLAAGLALQLACWLPVRFTYHENAYGIVSYSTLRRYPLQQETFWLVFAALVGALLCWLLARALARDDVRPQTRASVEALGALGLTAALWLPGVAGAFGCAAAAGLAIGACAARSSFAAVAPGPSLPARRWSAPRKLGFACFAALLAALLTPPIWASAWAVAHAVPDVQLVYDLFNFHAEMGQHLAWADAIRRGELHGKDFFCLYGPLYDMGIAGMWALTRRSIAAFQLYATAGRAASVAVALLLGAVLVRRKRLVLLLPFLLPWIDLRIGLALAGLLLLMLWSKDRKRALAFAAGLVAGAALLYSQEFGFALLVSAGAAFAITREAAAAASSRPGSPPWSPRCSAGSPRMGRSRRCCTISSSIRATCSPASASTLPLARREAAARARVPARRGRARPAPRLQRALHLRGCAPARRAARDAARAGAARVAARGEGDRWRGIPRASLRPSSRSSARSPSAARSAAATSRTS